jgi:hypothetical protein
LQREDAAMIALATLGTNQSGAILGVNVLVTYDRPMINGYHEHFTALQGRLHAMRVQLPQPFRYVKLPQLITPEDRHPLE